MTEPSNHCGYVALVGRPNVGKSTLLNRIIGVKLAITSHKAQTTRHNILGIKTLPSGQAIYVDTPGIHQRGEHAMNRYLNRTAKRVLADVDVLIFVVEALRWTREDEKVLQLLQERRLPVILAINKVDRVKPKQALLPFMAEITNRFAFQAVVPLSATRGDNVPALEKQVLQALPKAQNCFPQDQLSDRPERFFAAELLREQLTRRYSGELPYALSVEIEHFEEQADRYVIAAIVWVEKPGQKAILIGQEGQALKQAATRARRSMEAFFDCKVHLSVWIKVKKSWSSDEAALVRLGYGDHA